MTVREGPQRNANGAYLCATCCSTRGRPRGIAFPNQKTLGIVDVHSGSEETSLEGTPYKSW